MPIPQSPPSNPSATTHFDPNSAARAAQSVANPPASLRLGLRLRGVGFLALSLFFLTGGWAARVLADFTPAHPYLFLNPDEIQVMKDNVLVKQYPWAVALYQQARGSQRKGTFDTTCYNAGRHMLGCALVYLIDGDKTYADGAVSWLTAIAVKNWDPSVGTSGDFTQIHGIIAITYDLMYNYMKANRPTDLSRINSWMEFYLKRCQGNFGHNQGHQEQYGEAMVAYALGRTAHVENIATAFKRWYDGPDNVFDGFHYEPSSQAMKHWAIVFEGQVYYALATHRAAQLGYHSFDALTYVSAQGKNLVRDNWRMVLKKSTPRFQVPYESMWRGMLFEWPECTGTYHSIYLATGDPEWAAPVPFHPTRELDFPYCAKSQFCVMMYWAGLAHGRQLTETPRLRNDSFDQGAMGFTVMLSGDPAGYVNEDSLHAYLMHGRYGGVRALNLLLYGKGERLNTALMDLPNDTYGERGYGGSYVTPEPALTNELAPILLKEFSDPAFKIITVNCQHQRTVALTDQYFVDLYTANTNGTIYLDYDAIGPANTTANINGIDYVYPNKLTTRSFSVLWPNHQKLHMINEETAYVKLTKKTNLPNLVRRIYPSDPVISLQVKRTGVVNSTRFISVIEPIANGCRPNITSVTRFESTRKKDVTSLKINAVDYTDYIIYVHNADPASSITLTNGTESITLNGSYGYLHYDKNTSQYLSRGPITEYRVAPTGLLNASAPVITTQGNRLFEENIAVQLSCPTLSSTIQYTLDGTEPTDASPVYSSPLLLNETTTIKARATAPGVRPSATTCSTVTRQSYVVTPPVFSPGSTNFTTSLLVNITAAPANAVIRYTLDGSEPTETSTAYVGPLAFVHYAHMKARAFKPGWDPSSTTAATFVRSTEITPPPVVSPSGGSFLDEVIVSFTGLAIDAEVHYTLDGSDPTPSSPLYTGPFEIERSCTLKAIGINPAWAPSAITSRTFTIQPGPPTLSAEFEGDAVRLAWTPRSSAGIQGWTLFQRISGQTDFIAINEALIAAVEAELATPSYHYLDNSLIPSDASVEYYLVQLDNAGQLTQSATIQVSR